MHRNTLAGILFAVCVAVAAPALAAKGGNGNGNGGGNGTTSNIELATFNGVPAGASVAAVTHHYGDALTFSTTVEKLSSTIRTPRSGSTGGHLVGRRGRSLPRRPVRIRLEGWQPVDSPARLDGHWDVT
jgi:hypothetical protein